MQHWVAFYAFLCRNENVEAAVKKMCNQRRYKFLSFFMRTYHGNHSQLLIRLKNILRILGNGGYVSGLDI